MTGLFDRGPESFPHLCPHKVFFMRSSLYDPRQGKRAPTEEGPRWFVGYAEPLRPIVAALPSLFPKLRLILRIVGIDPAILAPEIGRTSCRERVWPSVLVPGVAG